MSDLILGLHASMNAFSHDSSACLIQSGRIVAATEEERISRNKISLGYFPRGAIQACLTLGGVNLAEVESVAVDGITYPQMAQKIRTNLKHHFGTCPPVTLVDHAEAHAAGAFLSSGFPEALVVSADGVGDKTSTLVWSAKKRGGSMEHSELYRSGFNESLGVFYTTFTSYLGFRQVEGEYKVMGMAAYGQPRYDLSSLLYFDSNSGAVVAPSGIAYTGRATMTSIDEPAYDEELLFKLTGVQRPKPGTQFTQAHFDLAASVQWQFQETYVALIEYYLRRNKAEYLCVAGGCALNASANRRLLDLGLKGVYIMPAASDRGISMGAAMLHANQSGQHVQPVTGMALGREFTEDEVVKVLTEAGIRYEFAEDVFEACSEALERGEVVGWFQGRSEYGPRALGQRSILANGAIEGMKDTLNRKIKFREAFRPFAPAVLSGEMDFSAYPTDLEYMTFTIEAPEQLKGGLPEAVHFDGTSRIQVVNPRSNPLFSELLSVVKKSTGFAGVINTSFNLAGEPIVDSPQDALRTFFSSGLDTLFLGNVVVRKAQK